MKTLTVAIAALISASGPLAFAAANPVQDVSAKTPPSSTAPRALKIGERITAPVLRKNSIGNPAELQLPEAPFGHRWMLVDGKAYLVHQDSLRIRNVVALKTK